MRVLAGVRDTGDSDDPSGSPPVFQVFCQKASTQARLIKASGIESVNTSAFGRSRPAADASREVVERWLLYGL
jgi:hypothetical protein